MRGLYEEGGPDENGRHRSDLEERNQRTQEHLLLHSCVLESTGRESAVDFGVKDNRHQAPARDNESPSK